MQIEHIQAINRSVIIIIPREPFFTWINSLDPENPMTPQNFPERTAYLIKSTDNQESAMKKCYAIIFESELNGMWTDPNDWPKDRSYKIFKTWFEWHIGSLVLDLENGRALKG